MIEHLQDSEEPRGIFRMIQEQKDPDQFIDLLCANNFFAGNLNNVMPVHENRITFERWLASHMQKQILQARIDEWKQIDATGDDMSSPIYWDNRDGKYVELSKKERVSELKSQLNQLNSKEKE